MERVATLSAVEIENILQQVVLSLGYSELKQHQKDAVVQFVSGKDVFVALPTGYGKSLVYGCLPLVFDIAMKCEKPSPIVVVMCPLKALMKDQAESFTSHSSVYNAWANIGVTKNTAI